MSERHQRSLRLPHDLADRVEREAGHRRISENTYIQMAVEEKLKADEARRKESAEQHRARRSERDERPRGLGLRLQPLTPPEPSRAPELPTNMTINVGGAAVASPEGDIIATLAHYVASGPMFSKHERKRAAVEILRSKGKTPEEREQLARRLDDALTERTRAEQRPAVSGIRRVFG